MHLQIVADAAGVIRLYQQVVVFFAFAQVGQEQEIRKVEPLLRRGGNFNQFTLRRGRRPRVSGARARETQQTREAKTRAGDRPSDEGHFRVYSHTKPRRWKSPMFPPLERSIRSMVNFRRQTSQ